MNVAGLKESYIVIGMSGIEFFVVYLMSDGQSYVMSRSIGLSAFVVGLSISLAIP